MERARPHPDGREALARLHAIGLLLSPRGTFFLDVNHRYNLRSYGLVLTCARWMRDFLVPDETNGDVRASWSFVDASISTYGHVFTHKEIMRLTESNGVELRERVVVDYQDGRIRRLG